MDVAASFLGKRNDNRYDIEDAVGTEVARAAGLPYHSRRGGARPELRVRDVRPLSLFGAHPSIVTPTG